MRLKLLFLFFIATYFSSFAHETDEKNSFPFTENKGQWNENILFLSKQEGADVYFEKDRFHYQFIYIPSYHAGNDPLIKETKGHVFDAQFLGSNPNVETKKGASSHSYKNYFIGNDKSKWASRVYNYNQFTYKELYNGIDLVVYTDHKRIKFDYRIAIGSSPNLIQVQYNGVDQPKISEGKLIVSHTMGELIEEKPFAYQIIAGIKQEVVCNYIMSSKGILSFDFPEGYDKTKELIIDPVLIFSTYSGSTSDNWGMTATYDNDGNGFMGGLVFGNQYVTTTGSLQQNFGGAFVDIAIAKFSSDGTNLEYATYLGGNDNETVHSMVTDSQGNLYIFGVSSSTNFPTTTNAFDRLKDNSTNITTEIINDNPNTGTIEDFGGGTDIVVSRISKDGDSLLSSTYFGGNQSDGINYNSSTSYQNLNYNYGDSHRGEIVLDSAGNCFIGTSTLSTNLPNVTGINSGSQDGLIIKFNPDLSSVIWSRFVGGTGKDAIYSLKVIGGGRVIVGGGSTSPSIVSAPSTSFQPANAGGIADGFISIISSSGAVIERSTFIGTANYDQVYFVEFDRFNNAYAYGQSSGGNFPTIRSPISNTGAGQFIIKLDKNLDSLEFSLTFGDGLNIGRINISPTAFLVDRCQNIYASGWGGRLAGDGLKTLTSNMPLANNGSLPFTSTTDNSDFYLYVANREVDSVLYASYFGGTSSGDHIDGGTSRFDKEGIIYQSVCASCGSSSTDFPTGTINKTTPVHSARANSVNCNNALFKLDFEILPRAKFSVSKIEGCTPFTFTISDSSVNATLLSYEFFGNPVSDFGEDTTLTIITPGTYLIKQVARDTICQSISIDSIFVTVRPNDLIIQTSPDTNICTIDSVVISANSNKPNVTYTWSANRNLSNPFLVGSINQIKVLPSIGRTVYYLFVEENLPDPCTALDSIVINAVFPSSAASLSKDSICEKNEVSFNSSFNAINKFQWNFGNGTIDSTNQNPIVQFNSSGTYTIRLIAFNTSCPTRDTNILTVNVQSNNLQLNSISDTTICDNQFLNYSINSSGSANSFIWSSNTNFSDTLNSTILDSNVQANPVNVRKLFYKIEDKLCELTDSFSITYIPYSLSLDPIIDSACLIHVQSVQANVVGADSFRIVSTNGASFANNPNPSFVFNQAGSYSISLLTSNALCDRRDTIIRTIRIIETVELQGIPDTLLCIRDSAVLISNSNGTAANYIWSTNPDFSLPFLTGADSSVKVSPNTTTTYYLKGETSICFDTDTINVNIENLTIDVNDFESFCIYDTISLNAMVISAASPLEYTWSPADSILSRIDRISVEIAPQVNQFYYLYTKSLTGCEDFDTVEVEVNLPAFDDAIIAGGDSLFKGQQTQLSTNRNGNNLTYQWEPAEDLDNPRSAAPNATLNTTKTYKVTITDLNTGCTVTALRRIKVFEVNCGEPDIFIPTAFSPNSDQVNDVLFVRGANIREVDFQLYNRWGELVFETTEMNKGWDGTVNGKRVDPGVFVYQIKAVCFDGQEFIDKGNITLLK